MSVSQSCLCSFLCICDPYITLQISYIFIYLYYYSPQYASVSSNYINSGHGRTKFRLVNMRYPVIFGFFTGGKYRLDVCVTKQTIGESLVWVMNGVQANSVFNN